MVTPAGLRDVQGAGGLARLPDARAAPGAHHPCLSNPGDVVLDPFGGSSTTLVTAKKLDRRFPGFELSPDYAAAIRCRLDAARSGDPLEGSPEPTAGRKGRVKAARKRSV
jgi:hypothetical protein